MTDFLKVPSPEKSPIFIVLLSFFALIISISLISYNIYGFLIGVLILILVIFIVRLVRGRMSESHKDRVESLFWETAKSGKNMHYAGPFWVIALGIVLLIFYLLGWI